MEAAAGHTLDDAGVGLAHPVYRETDGNPFFVGEVLRHLSETGAIYQDAAGRWMADDSLEQIALPDSVREVIGGRVVRLGETAGRALSMAAVIGRDFDLDLLARATKASEDELLDVLDAASAVALVRGWPTRGATTSPMPSSNKRCTKTSVLTDELGRIEQWPKLWRISAANAPDLGWANWPATGSAPPSPPT